MWSCMREKEIKAEGIHQAHLYSFILILKTLLRALALPQLVHKQAKLHFRGHDWMECGTRCLICGVSLDAKIFTKFSPPHAGR